MSPYLLVIQDAKILAEYTKNYNDLQIGDFILYLSPESKQNYVGYGKVLRKIDEKLFSIEIRVYNPGPAQNVWKQFCFPATKNIYLGWTPAKTAIIYQHNIHITEIEPTPAKATK